MIGNVKTQAVERVHAGDGVVNGLWSYLWRSRWAVVVTSPLLYACTIPFFALDVFASIYQAICFPIYGIPRVRRSEYIVYDRAKLRYLNLLERLNCRYCSYANGVAAYAGEIAARTEQHWCPIQHDKHPQAPHSRYARFLNYGDRDAYRQRVEEVRRDFRDLES
jgi:hypothetical protein